MAGRLVCACRTLRVFAKLIISLALVAGCLLALAQPAHALQTKKVLVLHSYHRGLSWNDGMDEAIFSVLRAGSPGVAIQVEYMDTKRVSDDLYYRLLFEIYAHKFKGRRFDVIICSDNNALNFLVRHGKKLFGETPVVFCGVNNFKDYMLGGQKGFTGTVEAPQIKETLELALSLRPGLKRVLCFSNADTTYFANKAIFLRAVPLFKDRLQVDFFEDFTVGQIQEMAGKLPSDAAIFLLGVIRDNKGDPMSFQRGVKLVSAVSKVPIYALWDFYLGHGAVGGKVISPQAQGESAAQMALGILAGTPVDQVPIVRTSPNRYMFDYEQMQRFGLTTEMLPPASVVINQPHSLYHEYKGLIFSALGLITLLVIVVMVLSINVAQRKRAEELTRQSQRRWQDIVDNSLMGICQVDRQGGFVMVNSRLAEMVGYSSTEDFLSSVKTPHGLYVNQDDRPPILETLDQGRLISGNEVEFRCKDGSHIWVRISARKIDDDTHGQLYESFVLDVTDRHQLEEQLAHSQKMEAIGNLAGGIAHDFNNLLQAISGYSHLMQASSSLSPDDMARVRNISRAAQRADTLVKQLLTFGRRMEPSFQDVDLRVLVPEVWQLLERTIPKMISLRYDLAPDLGLVRGDPAQIEQIFLNLATNARDAQPGGGEIVIRAANLTLDGGDEPGRPLLPAGEYIHLVFEDRGQGVPEENMAHIFEPFFSTKEVGKGTGLGLATAFGVVESHGGAIACRNRPERGARFDIWLPAARAPYAPQKPAAPPEQPQARPAPGTILVVDDEAALTQMLSEYLVQLGYTVATAGSGEEALEIFRLSPRDISLVILDLGMPGMGGEKTLEALRAIDPAVKVIIATGYFDQGQAAETPILGADALIKKPYQLPELVGLMNQKLSS